MSRSVRHVVMVRSEMVCSENCCVRQPFACVECNTFWAQINGGDILAEGKAKREAHGGGQGPKAQMQ